jgi:mannose-6-phosphate isomerase-like protein (cupin superfamily)
VPGQPIVVPAGEGHRVGNVEFLARTADTPRFTFGIIDIAPGREVEAHIHEGEDDAFYILEGVEHGFRNDRDEPLRFLNIHAPAGFDRRIGLQD